MKRLLFALLFATISISALNAQSAIENPPLPPKIGGVRPTKVKARRVGRPPDSTRPPVPERTTSVTRSAVVFNKPHTAALPAFAATARDGSTVTASSSAPKGHWLLLYRTAECVTCDRLMVALNASQSSALKVGTPYVIVVDSAKPDALDKVRAAYPNLNDATWLADSKKQAWAALKPKGYPMLYAMDGTTVMWSIPGTLGNPSRVESIASNWLAQPSVSALIAADRAAHASPSNPSSVTPSTPSVPVAATTKSN